MKIIRIRIGTLHLGNLKPGEWHYLSEAEVAMLKGQADKGRYKAKKVGKAGHIQHASVKGKRN